MNKKRELLGMYLPIFAILTLATVVIRTVACFTDYNIENGKFESAALISISDYITVGAVIYYLSYIITAKKDRKLIPSFTSAATYIPTGLTAAALLFFAKGLLDKSLWYRDIINDELYRGVIRKSIQSSYFAPMILTIAAAAASIFSILHFVFTAIDEKKHSGRRAKFGLFTVIMLALYASYLYFSVELPLNSRTKITDQMAYLSAAVFFLYETRISLGREKWRGYISYGFTAAALMAYSSIPSIIIYIARGDIISNSIYESILSFTLFIFITARIILAGELIEDKPSSMVSSIIAASDARSMAVTPAPAEESEPLENQITIEDIDGEKLTDDTTPEESEATESSEIADVENEVISE